MSYAQAYTQQIKHFARELGFNYCGVAKAEKLDEEARKLEQWLNKGYHGTMKYMEGHFDLRTNPTLLVPGAKSVLTLLFNYYPSETQPTDLPKISKYAYGKDYHEVIRSKLHALLQRIREHIGEVDGRGFVDSAPVLERAWAVKSGLGWVGKNGNLINKQQGSFFFIATLIMDLELTPDAPYAKDYCGSCTRCIDECPTEAILPNKKINGSKCISYYTIELKAGMEAELPQASFQNWMFGCDVCQDVCPWNRFSKPSHEPAFKPLKELFQFSLKDWEALTEEQFKELFRHSPIKRTKFEGIRRNLKWIQE